MEDRDLVLVNTVKENEKYLSVSRESRQAMETFGYSSQKTLHHMVRNINNLLVTISDHRKTNTIYR